MLILLMTGCAWVEAWLEPTNTSTPTVRFVSPEAGETFSDDEIVAFEVEVLDSGDNLAWVAVELRSDLDGVLCKRVPGVTGSLRCEAVLSPGTHRVTAIGEDQGSRTGQDTVSIRVVPPVDTGPTETGLDSDAPHTDAGGSR